MSNRFSKNDLVVQKKYKGQCHCGGVSFQYIGEERVTSGIRCNCSMCTRKGMVMSAVVLSVDELQISGAALLSTYQFGSKVAKHYFCSRCGVAPFLETICIPFSYRVNLSCVEGIDVSQLAIDVFDGRSLPTITAIP